MYGKSLSVMRYHMTDVALNLNGFSRSRGTECIGLDW